MKSQHELAYGLRFAMNFPDPELGKGLEEFIEAIDVQFYCQHLLAVAHNRRWLAGQLLTQGRHTDAINMFLAAEAADKQLLFAAGLLVKHNPNVEEE